jgi:Helix-hairpin-helix motif
MKITVKYSIQIALISVLALCPQLASAQSRKAAKEDAASKDAAKDKKSGGKTAPSAPVDLNTASQADLEKIPGVGTATAKKIVSGRPYSSVADLSKAGISAKTIQAITPMVTVSAKSAVAAGAGAGKAASTMKSIPPAPSPVPASTGNPKPAATPTASSSNAPGISCGPGTVWVNTATKVFHRAGSRWYGKTKTGKCMTEADAVKAGYRESKEG